MIAELVAINTAYSVIKKVIDNGKELHDCSSQLLTFFNGKSALQKKVDSTPPEQRNHLEEFFALEKIKQQEDELRQLMQWNCRAGLWDDWLQFQAQAARARREETVRIEREAIEKRERLTQMAQVTGITVLIVTMSVVLIISILYFTT